MRPSGQSIAVLVAATLLLAACGGSGDGIASVPAPALTPAPLPTPSPSPTPTPPPPFQPVAATIFPEPLYNPQLIVTGKGWQLDYVPNTAGVLNLQDADAFSVSYDQVSKTYQITVPVAGSGTIMRTGEYSTYPFDYASPLPGFGADPSGKNATDYCCNALSISASDHPQTRYHYVSFVDFFAPAPAGTNLETMAYGTFAVGQPTRTGEVPVSGTARYTGNVFGHFAGDGGATWIEGTSQFDFDFTRSLLTGDMTLSVACMMGCVYDSVVYTLTNTQYGQGSTTFSGSLTTAGAPADGSFSGLFAGPGAIEMMSQFQVPFFNPEYQKWMTAGGAIAGKRD